MRKGKATSLVFRELGGSLPSPPGLLIRCSHRAGKVCFMAIEVQSVVDQLCCLRPEVTQNIMVKGNVEETCLACGSWEVGVQKGLGTR